MKHKKIIIGTSVVLAASIGLVSVSVSAGTAIKSAAVTTGQLSCELELNGKVETLNEKMYYSNIDARISSVPVKEGDLVHAGDILVEYDADELTTEQMLAQYDSAAGQGELDDLNQYSGRMAGLYSEAKNTLPELNEQINATEAVIIQKREALDARMSTLGAKGAQLSADLACCVWEEGDDPEQVEKSRQNLEKEIAKNKYDQQYDPEILKLQDELKFLDYLMTIYTQKKTVMESQKAQTEMNLKTQGSKDRLEAKKAAEDLVNENKIKDIEEASSGIRAEFDAVVTKLSVEEGSRATKGQELVEIRSISDSAVVCYVNKYDIISIKEGQSASAHIRDKDYECVVSRIEKKTSDEGTSSGVRVELKITEPDEDIILGIEAKAKVRTATLAYAMLAPTDAICTDEEGDYVFVIEGNKARKRRVITGVSNDEMTEIQSGLKEGEIVGWDEEEELTDGQKVKVQ